MGWDGTHLKFKDNFFHLMASPLGDKVFRDIWKSLRQAYMYI